jgi:hypothetical protein
VKFSSWFKTIHFESDYLTYCFEEYLSEASRQIQRLALLDKKLKELEYDEEIRDGVKKLKCICGIDTIAAVGLVAEVGDFDRFRAAKNFASYTGLCPGRHSSGLSDRGTGITKQGNIYLRTLLIEVAKSLPSHGAVRKLKNYSYKTYHTSKAVCTACPLRSKCLKSEKSRWRNYQVLVASDKPDVVTQMINKIDSPHGREVYLKRMGIVEPVFADIRTQKRLDHFTLRT